jgi:hypothetical protein
MITAALAWLKGSKVAVYLAFAAAFVWGLLLLVGKLVAAGRDKERVAQAERLDTIRRQADEVRNDVDAASDVDADRLRDKWTRP